MELRTSIAIPEKKKNGEFILPFSGRRLQASYMHQPLLLLSL